MSASLTLAHSARQRGSASEVLQLALLGRERLHHRTPLMFSSTTVATSASRAWMSHDTGNICFRMRTPTMHDERHRRHRDERQRHVDRQHLHEREARDAALHEDRRREREVHLHRADVGVRPRDELARLHAVVERERHAAQVLVHDVPQVVLDPVRGIEQVVAGEVRDDNRVTAKTAMNQKYLVRLALRATSASSANPDQVGDLHLHQKTDEREAQRGDQQPLVRQHHRKGTAKPRLCGIGINRRLRFSVGH